jgi:hypothetical protein
MIGGLIHDALDQHTRVSAVASIGERQSIPQWLTDRRFNGMVGNLAVYSVLQNSGNDGCDHLALGGT